MASPKQTKPYPGATELHQHSAKVPVVKNVVHGEPFSVYQLSPVFQATSAEDAMRQLGAWWDNAPFGDATHHLFEFTLDEHRFTVIVEPQSAPRPSEDFDAYRARIYGGKP